MLRFPLSRRFLLAGLSMGWALHHLSCLDKMAQIPAKTRRRKSSKLAGPYAVRLIIFSRFT
jgi:hypothetical protein